MSTIYCIKTQENAPALTRAPYPGELGKKILANVSTKGWQLWLAHQTMLINENNLNMLDEKAQQYLKDQLEKFFFSDGSDGGVDKIEGWVPPKTEVKKA